IIAAAACFICSFSLQKGLERVTKYMMVALFILMIGMAIYVSTLSGAAEGLSFYLKPDFSKVNASVISEAMNQAFFTLSLGIGSMAVFGSYLGKDRSLMGESINIILLDTCVAIVAGLIIFPACFTFNVAPTEGAGLLFLTLPNVFSSIPGGGVLGALFFVFMTFAAFSTVLAVYENIIACVCELTGWSRKTTSLITCIGMILLNIPFILGNNVWSSFHAFGIEGKDVSDLEDFFVSTLMLPIGSLVYVIYCTRKIGWGWDKFIEEANTGKGVKFPGWIKGYVSFVLPLIIIVVFVLGLIAYFK
nr:sodium-dependent transporter [Lachnospiraceae bacterium]